ncbi:MAG TPA: hypothetical protein VND65_15290 [Candidatus Binatia bacterium]|nr:hypothetical protein [Candidatus Binatia bacterium]
MPSCFCLLAMFSILTACPPMRAQGEKVEPAKHVSEAEKAWKPPAETHKIPGPGSPSVVPKSHQSQPKSGINLLEQRGSLSHPTHPKPPADPQSHLNQPFTLPPGWESKFHLDWKSIPGLDLSFQHYFDTANKNETGGRDKPEKSEPEEKESEHHHHHHDPCSDAKTLTQEFANCYATVAPENRLVNPGSPVKK